MKRILSILLALTAVLVIMLQPYEYMDLLLGDALIDSTNHGWEVKRNKCHKQPDIPPGAREAITKYNGIYTGDPQKKVIYLTIDLGYESGNTEAILDTLKKNDVKATFFIVSSYMDKNPAVVDRIVHEGHSLQNHTANYRHLHTLTDNQVKKEILDMHNRIKDRYGITMNYLRLPYEEWSERVLKIASSLGYKTVFWSVACVDWVEGRDAGYIYKNVIDNYHNGAVILMHAVSKSSPEAVNIIVRHFKSLGYEFNVLDM